MAFFADNFTGTDGTQLQSHTPDTGTSWTRLWGTNASDDLEINGNACRPEATASTAGLIYTADATYPSANYDVTFTLVTTTSLGPFYVMVRIQDQENMYAVLIFQGTNLCRLYKKVSGTWTALGSLFDEPANGSVCKLEINGSTLKFYDDGVEVASATDSDITAAGKAGIGAGGGAELVTNGNALRTGNKIDSLTVNDLDGGGSVDLTIADATHAHVSDSIALAVTAYIAITDADHAHAADAIALVATSVLAIDEATHNHAVDSITLAGVSYLQVDDATHELFMESIVLSTGGTFNLFVHDSHTEHNVDSITLTANSYLAVSDANHEHVVDEIILTPIVYLVVADATHVHVADVITLSGVVIIAHHIYVVPAESRAYVIPAATVETLADRTLIIPAESRIAMVTHD